MTLNEIARWLPVVSLAVQSILILVCLGGAWQALRVARLADPPMRWIALNLAVFWITAALLATHLAWHASRALPL